MGFPTGTEDFRKIRLDEVTLEATLFIACLKIEFNVFRTFASRFEYRLKGLADAGPTHGLLRLQDVKDSGAFVGFQSPGVAARNAARYGVTRASFLASDWLRAVTGSYDLIVSNPPYIAQAEMAALAPEVRDWEPPAAQTPGGDGLDAYRRITASAPARLTPGGRILLEIGPTQAAAVSALLAAQGLENIHTGLDLDGRDRVVSARKPLQTAAYVSHSGGVV